MEKSWRGQFFSAYSVAEPGRVRQRKAEQGRAIYW